MSVTKLLTACNVNCALMKPTRKLRHKRQLNLCTTQINTSKWTGKTLVYTPPVSFLGSGYARATFVDTNNRLHFLILKIDFVTPNSTRLVSFTCDQEYNSSSIIYTIPFNAELLQIQTSCEPLVFSTTPFTCQLLRIRLQFMCGTNITSMSFG